MVSGMKNFFLYRPIFTSHSVRPLGQPRPRLSSAQGPRFLQPVHYARRSVRTNACLSGFIASMHCSPAPVCVPIACQCPVINMPAVAHGRKMLIFWPLPKIPTIF